MVDSSGHWIRDLRGQLSTMTIRPKALWTVVFTSLGIGSGIAGATVDLRLFITSGLLLVVAWNAQHLRLEMSSDSVEIRRPPLRPIHLAVSSLRSASLERARPPLFFPRTLFIISEDDQVIMIQTWFWSDWSSLVARLTDLRD